MPDLAKQKWRSRLEAWLLDAGASAIHEALGDRKADVIGSMSGTVVEFGPGTGSNMRYYAPGTKVIAIEPNPVMHERLHAHAEEFGVDLEVRTIYGESVDVDSESADGVVGTLLLCGVADPSAVVGEIHRVLKPGGTYFFHEHVVAPEPGRTRTMQRVVRRPHFWLFNGCRVDQDTGDILRNGPFDDIEIDEIDRRSIDYIRYQIVGTARKASAHATE
ncbi:MAG: class I SAM-dependent methyltransferase [Ilumatobacter sp.]|jgi:SAM-dependent methyltransferase|uniref:class I SAM-dependent methyltransferase n=1 Tax=Ilumatobacter sp. TaxID=1967498 RepID=UPI00391CD505